MSGNIDEVILDNGNVQFGFGSFAESFLLAF